MKSYVIWVDATDCEPPHGLDMQSRHDADKVYRLAEAFAREGFDRAYPALVGYPKDGRIQLLSGTHRHRAALLTGVKLPVTLWLRSYVEGLWGTEQWKRLISDIPVATLERMDLEPENDPELADSSEVEALLQFLARPEETV